MSVPRHEDVVLPPRLESLHLSVNGIELGAALEVVAGVDADLFAVRELEHQSDAVDIIDRGHVEEPFDRISCTGPCAMVPTQQIEPMDLLQKPIRYFPRLSGGCG